MVDLGGGIALGGFCVSAAAVWITAIRSKTAERREEPKREDPNGTSRGHCLDHSGIDVCLKGVNHRLDGMDAWLGEISNDVKALREKAGITSELEIALKSVVRLMTDHAAEIENKRE